MDITFLNPGVEYMLGQIMEFQTDDTPAFWSQPLYHFYPQLDKTYAESLPFPERRVYIEGTLREVYQTLAETIDQKVQTYARHWRACKGQVEAALSEAFAVDCATLFDDLRCYVTLNPIEPRFPAERRFDIFYLNSEKGAVGEALHEIVHLVWFAVWNRVFQDSYAEYERPSLKWILSEMVVESVMKDERLSSLNPYFPRENGGCVYPCFFDMMADGKPVLETLDAMYRSQPIEDFMRSSYVYCQAHEAEIRAHIQKAEG